MIDPPDFEAGDILTASSLNDWSDAARSAEVSVDASGGLVNASLSGGVNLRIQPRAEGWFKVTAAPSGSPSGSYQLTEQVDLPNGAFATGQKVRIGYPTPGSGTVVVDGSKIVRAWRDRASWRFEYGSC